MSGALQAVFQNLRSFGSPPGQQVYTSSGTYSWVAPAGVTSVSAVALGGGAPGANGRTFLEFCPCTGQYFKTSIGGGGGGGGALAYTNNISVTPGTSYTVTVQPGNTSGMPSSSFGCFVSASSGSPGVCFYAGTGGNVTVGTGYSGGNGGTGCASSALAFYPSLSGAGGGGAAGYASNGGKGGVAGQTGSTANGQTKTGGAGGGGGGGSGCNYRGGAGGGGSNVYGTLSPYCDTAGTGGGLITGGGGVYGGSNAGSSSNTGGSAGAIYGGGGGGGSVQGSIPSSKPAGTGGGGAVRIIWPGTTRQYPSTCTNDV